MTIPGLAGEIAQPRSAPLPSGDLTGYLAASSHHAVDFDDTDTAHLSVAKLKNVDDLCRTIARVM